MLKFIYIIKQKRGLKKVLRNHVLSLGGAGGNEYQFKKTKVFKQNSLKDNKYDPKKFANIQ